MSLQNGNREAEAHIPARLSAINERWIVVHALLASAALHP